MHLFSSPQLVYGGCHFKAEEVQADAAELQKEVQTDAERIADGRGRMRRASANRALETRRTPAAAPDPAGETSIDGRFVYDERPLSPALSYQSDSP